MSLLRWKIVIIFIIFTQFFLACSLYNYNVFFVDLQREFRKSAIITGWVGALGSAVMCLASPLAAVIGNKIGNLRLVLAGIFLLSTGYMTSSFIHSLEYGFLTYGIIAGLGSSLMLTASGSLMLDWFSCQKNSCLIMTTCLMGSSCDIMALGSLLTLSNAAYGWRNSLRILSGFVLVVGIVDGLFFLFSPERQHRQLRESIDKKISPDQVKCSDEETDEPEKVDHEGKTSMFKDPEYVHVSTEPDESGTTRITMAKLLLNAEVWFWVTSITLSQTGWSFVIVNYSSFMDGNGLSTDQISVVLTLFGAGEIGGKLLFAAFGDCLPFYKLYAIAGSSVSAAVVSGFLTISSAFEDMIILAIAWGILRGISYGSSFAAGDELFNAYSSASVTSIVLFGYGVGVILGSPLTGGLYDLTGDYALSLTVLVVIFVLSALSMILIPIKRRIQSWCKCCQSTPASQSDTYYYRTTDSHDPTETEAVDV